ncbi:hypothetical protein GMO_28250 [Gluconobacter morbifer G707]|uniref:Uncharacterized protein n=1 Tax=Gluconobacter morbifer G707 TaxID=1088869 RepID=G6XMV7_9PROT|nr:hypothetical protein GMO_28250 [Gluconobacter morbifer G707]
MTVIIRDGGSQGVQRKDSRVNRLNDDTPIFFPDINSLIDL